MDGPFYRVVTGQSFSSRAIAPIAFLDRDGVINRGRASYVNHPDEVVLLDGVGEAIGALKRHGFLVCVVTNQSPMSRGLWDEDQLVRIHRRLQSLLHEQDAQADIDAFITCPHRFEDGCGCRKPSPSMLNLGHWLLRADDVSTEIDVLKNAGPMNHQVDWWGTKPHPPHRHDVMVGDRQTDVAAGWAYGARVFRVNAQLGLAEIVKRILDTEDSGDSFQP